MNEGSTESNAVNVYFQSTFETLARSAYWNCLKRQAPLTLVASAPGTPTNPQGATLPYPDNPWLYSYLVPSDSLAVRQIMPPRPVMQNGSGTPIFPTNNYVAWNAFDARRLFPFEVGYGLDKNGNTAEVVNANLGGALAVYTVNQPNPQFWDSMFQQAMVAALAVFLSASVSGDKALTQIQKQTADALIIKARAMDGNEGTKTQERQAEWISARNGETGNWSIGFNTPWLNYGSVDWPAG